MSTTLTIIIVLSVITLCFIHLFFRESKKYKKVSKRFKGVIDIENEKQKNLFNAYAQLQDRRGVLPKGTGLGLAVSKMIIEAHSGIIAYRNGEESGSEFYFRIPC